MLNIHYVIRLTGAPVQFLMAWVGKLPHILRKMGVKMKPARTVRGGHENKKR